MRLSRQAVSDLADEEFQHRLIEVFVRRLEAVEGTEREHLASAAAGEGAVVEAPVEFSPELRLRMEAALGRAAGAEVPVEYRTDAQRPPEVVLNVGGVRFSWGVESYFDAMEEYLCELLDLSDGECREGEAKG